MAYQLPPDPSPALLVPECPRWGQQLPQNRLLLSTQKRYPVQVSCCMNRYTLPHSSSLQPTSEASQLPFPLKSRVSRWSMSFYTRRDRLHRSTSVYT